MGEIRTHGPVARSAVFKTAALNHSATTPGGYNLFRRKGGDQPIRRKARAFAAALHARYALPVVMIDERSSSVEAAQRFAEQRAQGRVRRRDAAALDAVAAAVIVERWLAAPDDATPLTADTP